MLNAFIFDGLRTAFGRHAGGLASVRPDDLIGELMRVLIERSPWEADVFEDAIVGCTCQEGEDSRNVARNALLAAGLPVTLPGQTVNRLCASGLAAIVDAARAVTCGEGELFVAGGVESMSRAPFVVAKAESAYSRDFKVFDTTIGARFPNPKLVTRHGNDTMPETGDNVARDFGITREQSDRFAASSQARFERARQDGFFAGEIHPISVPTGRKTPPRVVDADEHPRPDTSFDSLGSRRAVRQASTTEPQPSSSVARRRASVPAPSRWRVFLRRPWPGWSHGSWASVRHGRYRKPCSEPA